MITTRSTLPLALLLMAAAVLRADEKPSLQSGLFRLFAAAKAGAAQPEIETVPPIQIVAATRTFRDVEKEQRLWWERVMVAPALARLEKRSDAPPWAADARKLLADAPCIVFAEPWQEKPIALQPIARSVVDAGCDDPAVLILAVFIQEKCDIDWKFALRATSTALETLDADPSMPAVLSFFCSTLAAQATLRGYDQEKCSGYRNKIPALITRMASDSSYLPNEEELFVRHLYLVQDALDPIAEKILALAPQLPLPAWVQQTLIGFSHQTIAWKDGKDYEKHLGLARTALTQAWKLNRSSPLAASKMIYIGRSNSAEGETPRSWFDRATAAQCDYPPAYSNMLFAYRSEGEETLLAFGKACAATKRYDLDIPVGFTRICNDIADRKKDWHSFYRRPDVATVLLEVSEGLANEPTRAYERYMRLSYLAVNSWLVGEYARAAAALDLIKGPLHPDTFNKLSLHRKTEVEMREEVCIGNSPIAEDFQAANVFYQQGNLAEAKARLKIMEPRAQGAAAEGVYDKLLVIEIEEALARGEWVTLPVDPEFRGWLLLSGKWSCEGEGTLVNHGNDSRAAIVHRSRIGANFEMYVEFSITSKPDTGVCCKRCEVMFDWRESGSYNIASYGQDGSSPMRPRITGSYRTTQPKDTLHRLPTDNTQKFPYQKVNTMLLRSLDQKISLTCNGIEAFKDYNPENFRSGTPDGHVGIGSHRWCNNNKTLISRIQVRRLAAAAK